MKNFMLSWFSIENSATFAANTCLYCQRLFDVPLQNAVRPLCILPSYHGQQIFKHANEGNPIEYDLPNWDPLACSVKIDK
jgi:hypothetical protein